MSAVRSASPAQSRDDRVLLEVRIAALFVVGILILAVLALYFNPERTNENFAWTIKPPLTAIAMGCGYLMGMYFFLRVATLKQWHHAALGFLPITSFTVWMLLATLLHLDRFNQGSFFFALWVIVYIITPILVPLLWLRNRAADPGMMAPDDVEVPRPLRWVAGGIGALFVLITVVCFVFPQLLIAVFPWTLTPLTARVVAGWLSFPGVGGLLLARERRWSSWRLVFEAAFVGILFFVLALPRGWNDLKQGNPLTWLMLAVLIGSLIVIPLLYFYMERMRSTRVGAAEGAASEDARV